jgi:beta-lactamase class C
MTGLLLAQQVDAAKAQLNDSVTDYLPLPQQYEDITLVNLATHTSGLPMRLASNKTVTTTFPTYAIDEEWQYSNIGIGLLGESVVKIAHTPLDQLFQKNLLMKPLKMNSSGITISAKDKKYIAQGYNAEGQPVPLMEKGTFPAAYAMKVSAADMQKFLAAAIGLPGTPERIFYQMRMSQSEYVKLPDRKQGLGWEIHSIKPNRLPILLNESEKMNLGPMPVQEMYDRAKFNGNTLIDKTGTADGFSTYVALIPDKQSGVAILTNKVVSHGAIVNLGRKILFESTKMLSGENAS